MSNFKPTNYATVSDSIAEHVRNIGGDDKQIAHTVSEKYPEPRGSEVAKQQQFDKFNKTEETSSNQPANQSIPIPASGFIKGLANAFMSTPTSVTNEITKRLVTTASKSIMRYSSDKIKGCFGVEYRCDPRQTEHFMNQVATWIYMNFNAAWKKYNPTNYWWEQETIEDTIKDFKKYGLDRPMNCLYFPSQKILHIKIDTGTYLRVAWSDIYTSSLSWQEPHDLLIYFYGKRSKYWDRKLRHDIERFWDYGKDSLLLQYYVVQASESLLGGGAEDDIFQPRRRSSRYDMRSAGISRRQGIFHKLDTVAMTDEIRKDITDFISFAVDSKNLYEELSLTATHAMLLYGPPGTGKSSIVKAIYRELGNLLSTRNKNGANLFMFDLANVRESIDRIYDWNMEENVNNSQMNIIVMEDIDIVIRSRESCKTEAAEANYQALLQFLDGITTLNNTVIVATTNRYDALGEDLIREGRFDKHLEIGGLREAECEYLMNTLKIPQEAHPEVIGTKEYPINGNTLENICLEWHKNHLIEKYDLNK